MRLVPDDELERLATEHGPDSYQASMLSDLRRRRTKETSRSTAFSSVLSWSSGRCRRQRKRYASR
jgi:hypothetical protein